MLAKQFKRVLRLRKIAQQLRLPGVQEPQIDLPGVPLQMPPRVEPNRHDLNSIDLSEIKNYLHSDVKKIINHELKANPSATKEQIVDLVLNRAKEDADALIKEYIQKIPSLKAKIPGEQKQMSLPGAPPDIRIFPTKEQIEEDKAKLEKDYQEKILEYDAAVEKFKFEHDGKEPQSWEIGLSDPRKKRDEWSSYGRMPRAEDVKLDLEQISQGQYKAYLNKLYSVYYEIQSNYDGLDALYEQLGDIVEPSALPAPEPDKFTSYQEMIYDLQKRVTTGIQSVIKNSVGLSLFGGATGKHRRRWNREVDIFTTKEDEWFDDPEKMKAFLEEIPRVYNHKDEFWRSWGISANELDFWFRKKYEVLSNYNDSLKRAKTSFGKGMRFYKSIDKKLSENVNKFLDTTAFKYSEYIQTAPEHRAKLNALYLQIVDRINESSRVLGRTGYYYNNGLYEESTYSHRESDYTNVDLGAMLVSKVPQYKMIESLSKLLISSILKVAKQINDNELGPFIKQLSQEMSAAYIKENLKLNEEDLPIKTTGEGDRIEREPVYADPRAIKVAEAWLQFASTSKLATNFHSLVKYPEFIFRGDADSVKFLAESMKEKLGYLVTKLLSEKLANVFYGKIAEMVNNPAFTYRGPNELRKTVVEKKQELYVNVQKGLDVATEQGAFELTLGERVSMADAPVMPRYEKIKGILKAAIGNTDSGSKFFQQLSYRSPYLGYNQRPTKTEELDAETIANKIIYETMTGHGRSYYDDNGGRKFMDAFLKYDAMVPLKRNLNKRQAEVIGASLVNKGYFVPMQVQERVSGLYAKDLNTKADVESLKELKLPLDFSNIDLDRPFLSLIASMAGKSIDEVVEALPGIIARQQELNQEFNAELDKAIEKLNYLHEVEKKMRMEIDFTRLFSHRLQIFGGVGPNAINGKFQELTKVETFQHMPLTEMAKLANEKTITEIKDGDWAVDDAVHLYKQFDDDDKKGTNLGVAVSTIAKTLGLKDARQLTGLYHSLDASLREKNIAREDIEYIFPALITNLDALPSQLEAAQALAKFAHSEGEGLSKETILSFARNPNFKDWIKEVDAIENFFDVYITIQRKGGPKKIVTENKTVIDALVKTRAIKKGFMRRLQLITQAFENGTRINPSIEGFDSIRKLINQTDYDLEAVESYATFAEYNNKIEEQKLFKDPMMFKLNWNMPEKKFRFRVLDTFDPYHFQVGVDTDCCQKLGGAGEAAAIDSYINPLAGVVLLEAVIEGEYKTVAQSYFHYVPTDNGIILDNVETSDYDDNLKEITGYDIDQLYAWWAAIKKEQRKYKYFLCGTSYNKLSNESYSKQSMKSDPRSFKHTQKYTDWRPSSSVDLFRPTFELPEEAQIKKKQKKKRTAALFDLFPLMAFYKVS